jgi:hypothetical protein
MCLSTGEEKSILFRWRWPDKRAEPFRLSLIFFVTFLYQDKKINKQSHVCLSAREAAHRISEIKTLSDPSYFTHELSFKSAS